MAFIFAVLAGFIIGGGTVGYVLSQRWKTQVHEAEAALQEVAELHKTEQQQNKNLSQELAGLKFELNQARNELRALKGNKDD